MDDSRGDVGLVRLADNTYWANNAQSPYPSWVVVLPSMDNGFTTTTNYRYGVGDYDDSYVGMTECDTGSRQDTGTDCGTVRALNLTVGGVGHLTRGDQCHTGPGDSGAPVWRQGLAYGVLSGGLVDGFGCAMLYSEISSAQDLLGANFL